MARSPRALCRDPGHLIALGFGTGLAPVAPGTVGSVVAVLIGCVASTLSSAAAAWAVTLVMAPLAVVLCGRTARALGVHDHPAIVADEFAGQWLAMTLIGSAEPRAAVLAFFWFRVFDIAKPWPIRVLDARLSGGLGIVVDDLAAGLAAGIVARLTLSLVSAGVF